MLGRLTRTLPVPEEIQKKSSSVPLETPDEKPMSEDERLLLCGTVVVKLMVLEIEPALKRGKDMTPSHAFNDNVPQFRTRTKALRRITPAGIHYRGIELGNSNNTQGRNIKKI